MATATRNQTIEQVEARLRAHGVSSLKVVWVAGMCWAICRFGVGVGADLATAIEHVVAIVEEAQPLAVTNDGPATVSVA